MHVLSDAYLSASEEDTSVFILCIHTYGCILYYLDSLTLSIALLYLL